MPHHPISIRLDDCFVSFSRPGGGFPTRGGLIDSSADQTIFGADRPWLSVELPDGQTAGPFWLAEYQPLVVRGPECTTVEFHHLPWRTDRGNILQGCQLTLRYEFWPDGVAFAQAFFTIEGSNPPDLAHFRLAPPVTLPAGDEVSWAYWDRPDHTCANLIQSLAGVQRFQAPGAELVKDHALLPYVSFDFGSQGRRDRHLEFFLEGAASLGADQDNVRTALRWSGPSPHLEWDFLSQRRSSPHRPWRWRNRWGWTLCRAPRRRRHAPLRMYHYIDADHPYPSDRQLQKMAAEGADLLVLHEQWRSDPQDGGTPCCPVDFRRMVDTARRQGLRLALYLRGNEPSVREDGARWFDQLLQRDHDGLYMDFGTPVCYSTALDETYPAGRLGFREYYLAMRRLRRRVGENGILLSHSGPFFAACGMAGIVDGYVAGEGERGVLLGSPTAHGYFSGLSVAPPTLWTAAFPEYRSNGALPWLASVAQVPHVALGTQIQSSSLQHPSEPGNVTFARPLWKLWGLLRGQRDLVVLHQQNTSGVLVTGSPQTTACLFRCADGSLLLVAANCDAAPHPAHVAVDWKAAGAAPHPTWTAFHLDPHATTPAASPLQWPGSFAAPVPAFGVVGWLLTGKPEAWSAALQQFRQPYPAPDAADQQYHAALESLRQLRFKPSSQPRLFLRLAIPDYAIPYEDSVWWDLFDSCNAFVRLLPGGRQEPLGFIGRKGLVPAKPGRADLIYPGVHTPWIALHDVLPPGPHDLAVLTTRQGEPFYSFVTAEFTTDPATLADHYLIRFANELDSDRSRLTFAVDLARAPGADHPRTLP